MLIKPFKYSNANISEHKKLKEALGQFESKISHFNENIMNSWRRYDKILKSCSLLEANMPKNSDLDVLLVSKLDSQLDGFHQTQRTIISINEEIRASILRLEKELTGYNDVLSNQISTKLKQVEDAHHESEVVRMNTTTEVYYALLAQLLTSISIIFYNDYE